MDRITTALADFASGLTYADLDGALVHSATQRLVDSIGCALAGRDGEGARIGRRLAAGQTGGKFPGRILCHGDHVSAEAASFVNTAMIRALDFNDRYPGGHPSDCLGALLALAGAAPTDGKRFLASMVVIYEIFARLSDSARLSRRGWDQGFAIAVSTTAGVCNFLNLSRAATANAIGIAAASSLPLRVTRSGELTSWKNAATAFAARNGVFAALLAAEGMVGPGSAFEGRNGLWENVTGPFELELFPNAGGTALTPRVQLKYWPVETNAQPVIWAALDLRQKADWNDLVAIEVFTSKFTWFEIGSEPEKWDPQTPETADHSLPYIFARALFSGPINAASFTPEMVRDPALRPLMACIKVTIDDAIEALLPQVKLRVKATRRDGSVVMVEVENPRGHPDNPMDDDAINTKFLSSAEPQLGTVRSRAILEGWWQIKDAGNMSPLFGLLENSNDGTTKV
jgi:2-methylcitrate dehydratase